MGAEYWAPLLVTIIFVALVRNGDYDVVIVGIHGTGTVVLGSFCALERGLGMGGGYLDRSNAFTGEDTVPLSAPSVLATYGPERMLGYGLVYISVLKRDALMI